MYWRRFLLFLDKCHGHFIAKVRFPDRSPGSGPWCLGGRLANVWWKSYPQLRQLGEKPAAGVAGSGSRPEYQVAIATRDPYQRGAGRGTWSGMGRHQQRPSARSHGQGARRGTDVLAGNDGKFLYQYVTKGLDDPLADLAFAGHTSSPMIEGDVLWFTTIFEGSPVMPCGPLPGKIKPT
jgi:hypothetical protein